jgi:hypothetical protein
MEHPDPMPKKVRILPPVCLSVAILELLTGKLRMSREFVGCETISDDGQAFTVFRQIKKSRAVSSDDPATFVVRFKFAHLSHRANKLASIIPMLLIAGFPGFVQKLYAVNKSSGYWQGMYEWRSANHLEIYKTSFVYRMMNKRAIKGTVETHSVSNSHLLDQLHLQENIKKSKKIKG